MNSPGVPADAPSKKRRLRFGRPRLRTLLITFLILVLAVSAGYFYYRYQTALKTNTEWENQQVIKAVSRLMELPEETPTVATVTQKDLLANQWFFRNAENGDKVLIFPNEKKAILYRPSEKKIIEVSPINPDATPKEGVTTVESGETGVNQNAPIEGRIVLYNGTTTAGLTREVENYLQESTEVTIVSRNNARSSDYQKTLVVDVTGQNSENARRLASLLSAGIGPLPPGEATPEADLLVIIGQDWESR